MNAQSVSMTSIKVLVSGLVVLSGFVMLAADPCQAPNPNTVSCGAEEYTKSNCFGTTSEECTGTAEMEFNQIPDGAVAADEGTTAEDDGNCKRSRTCEWNNDLEICETSSWSAWSTAQVTVAGTNPCPPISGE